MDAVAKAVNRVVMDDGRTLMHSLATVDADAQPRHGTDGRGVPVHLPRGHGVTRYRVVFAGKVHCSVRTALQQDTVAAVVDAVVVCLTLVGTVKIDPGP